MHLTTFEKLRLQGGEQPITATQLLKWVEQNKQLTALTTWMFDPPKILSPSMYAYLLLLTLRSATGSSCNCSAN